MGCVQESVVYNSPPANLEIVKTRAREAKEAGVELLLFPEAFLTGYCVDTIEEAQKIAIRCHCPKDFDVTDADPSLVAIQGLTVDLDIHLIVGLAGKDDFGLFNGAVLFEPDGRMRRYIKTHLPFMGFDRFVDPGAALPVFQTEVGAIGIAICFDLRHPEPFRIMAMQGAELIVLPTNWPSAPHAGRDALCKARAVENKIFLASANRLGDENGTSFRGLSGIYDFEGNVLAQADDQPGMITADLDLHATRNKRNVIVPGMYETSIFDSRRPDLYSSLSD